jgi:hypothetical protein
MRYVIIFLFLISVALVVYGFYIKPDDMEAGELFIGLGVACGFLILMPVFLYHRWKGKSAKDYMLTNESFKKMREYETNKEKEKRSKKDESNNA